MLLGASGGGFCYIEHFLYCYHERLHLLAEIQLRNAHPMKSSTSCIAVSVEIYSIASGPRSLTHREVPQLCLMTQSTISTQTQHRDFILPIYKSGMHLPVTFFSLPPELRQHIYNLLLPYGVHIYSRDGTLHLSTCINETKDSDRLNGYERQPVRQKRADASENEVCKKRLQSSWGPHWMWEERMNRKDHKKIYGDMDFMAILQACNPA